MGLVRHPLADGPRRRTAGIVLLAMVATLAGCANDRPTGGSSDTPGARAPGSAPNMTGRWTLSSPGAGSCAMAFGGAVGAGEGTIAPEGGCPGNFFTSRKWSFERDALVIKNHLGEALAQLKTADAGRFDGQSTAGQQVTLSR
jgi:hypothetical protein